MSFMSMLQMAKGKDPPPEPDRKPKLEERRSQQSATRPARPANTANPAKPTKPARPEPAHSQSLNPTPNRYSLYEPSSKTPMRPTASAGSSIAKHNRPQPSNGIKGTPHTKTETQKPSQRTPLPSTRTGNPNHLPNKTNKTNTVSKTAAPPSSSLGSGASASGGDNPVKKKLSFKDMMKQASSIDKSKLEVKLRVANKSKQERLPRGSESRPQRSQSPEKEHRERKSNTPPPPMVTKYGANSQRPTKGEPAPVARPSPELLEAIEKKKHLEKLRKRRYEDSDEEELDDFVVDEEEEGQYGRSSGPSKHSEEIWALFNRKPRTAYTDEYSDDDMEAGGADILAEERRSAATARREDLEEERRLEELAQKKKARRLK